MIEENKLSDELTLYSKDVELHKDLEVLVSKSNNMKEAVADFQCFLGFLTRGMLEQILNTMDEIDEHIEKTKKGNS